MCYTPFMCGLHCSNNHMRVIAVCICKQTRSPETTSPKCDAEKFLEEANSSCDIQTDDIKVGGA